MKRITICLLCLLFLFSGCGETTSEGIEASESIPMALSEADEASLMGEASAEEEYIEDPTGMFSQRDLRGTYDVQESIAITLSGDSGICDFDGVEISDSQIKIVEPGTYVLSGTLTDGMVIVDVSGDDKVQLVLNNVSIHSETSAAIYVSKADKVFITMPEGTKNSLSSGESYVAIDDKNIDAAVFSRDDLTLNGTGQLTISAPGGHGVVSKNSLTITGGSYTIEAASHGLSGKDDICIAGGSFELTTGKDGIHAANKDDATVGFVFIAGGDYHIVADGDGISGESYVELTGGSFDIVTGGGSENAPERTNQDFPGFPWETETTQEDDSVSTKGIKAEGDLTISGGTFKIDAADDTIHSNGSVYITGGTFDLATGDDGVHADVDLDIADGVIGITTSYEGLEGLNITISGGVISLVAEDDGINAAGELPADATEEETDATLADASLMVLAASGDEAEGGFPEAPGGGFGGGPGGGGPGGDFPGGDIPDGNFPDGDFPGGDLPDDNFPGGGFQNGDRGGGFPGFPGGGFPGMGNSNASLVISGGEIYINASGDAIDSNGTLEITGGSVVSSGPTWGDTSILDFDKTGTISGEGSFIGTGSTMMSQVFNESEHGQLYVKTGNQSANTELTIADAEGNILVTITPENDYALLICSFPELVKGETYRVSAGTFTADVEAY